MKQNEIGNRLLSLRKEKSVRQKDIADACGVSAVTMWKWEQGQVQPPLDAVVAICKFYSVSADYLLGLSDDTKKDPPTEVDEPTVTVAVPVDDPALSTQSAFQRLLESLVEDALHRRGL